MLHFVFRVFSHFPLRLLHAIGAALAWCVYLFAKGYRTRLRANLRQAGFDDHWKAAVSESGKSLSELPFVWGASVEKVRAKIAVENWGIVQEALDADTGIIFLTPHLGCFEVTIQVLGPKMPLTVMYRPPRVASHKPLFEEGRRRAEVKLAATNMSGVRNMIKALRGGEAVGLLPDHVPRQGDGVWADFYGRSAYTITLPSNLQKMSKARIILTYGERLPKGRGYRVRFFPFDEDMGETPEQQARAINAAMESMISQSPAQYFWSYDRYRQPSPPLRPARAQEASAGENS